LAGELDAGHHHEHDKGRPETDGGLGGQRLAAWRQCFLAVGSVGLEDNSMPDRPPFAGTRGPSCPAGERFSPFGRILP